MRRLLCLVLPLALLVSACSSDDDAAPTANGDLASVTVNAGEAGTAPTLTFAAPFAVDTSTSRVISEGDGEEVADGALTTIDYVVVDGTTGTQEEASTWTGDGQPIVLDGGVLPALKDALVGQSVGAEVLIAIAPSDSGATSTATDTAASTVLFLVDVRATGAARATGEPVAPVPGLPTVTLADDGAPTITVPADTEAPTATVVQPLITGTGPQVQAGQTITVQYTGVKWSDGAVFDSSWANGASAQFPIGTGAVIAGWDTGLVSQPVGSQVLLIVPPADGYGAAEGNELQNETLVFVVDILAAN